MFWQEAKRIGGVLGLAAVLLALSWAADGAVAQEGGESPGPLALQATVSSRINYQGVLEEGGAPVNGTRNMTFDFFTNAACSGVAVHNTVVPGVPVTDGFFDVDVSVSQDVFRGEGVWLRVIIGGTTFGCDEVVPVPYALGLRPGATMVGPGSGGVFGDAALNVENNAAVTDPGVVGIFARAATGAAIRAESASTGLFAQSDFGPAVVAGATTGSAGSFDSAGGYGIRVNSDGTDHWDHGAYVTAEGGYGVLAQSTQNMAIRGEAGDVSAIPQPLGTVGVVGIGAGRGVFGASGNGVGVYGSSTNSYAGYFYSQAYRGVYTSSPSGYYAGYFNNRGGAAQPGVYVNGTLMVTGSKSGYVVDIVQNAGPDVLETGDVVVIAGSADPVVGEIPLILVRRASEAASAAVVGVVDQPFAVDPDTAGEGPPYPAAARAAVSSGTAVDVGAYAGVVTLGAFKAVRVDADYGAIAPGDLLVSSPTPGHAMRADVPAPGTVIGKALDAWDAGRGTIAVMVTLQ